MASKQLFRTGKKQVFLPDHTVIFLRPRDTQPPNFASFQVPLTFNKLDLRDYLLHAYNVPVLSVRSQLTQRRPIRSKVHHRIYRPPPIKTMTVELHQPFVWPEEPEDKSEWNTPWMEKREQERQKQEELTDSLKKSGKWPLRDETGATHESLELRKEAKRLLREGNWSNRNELDPKFVKEK
ncbi:uncharacterized protein F4822DRAFT_314431 [Hypoxylon trugodes]|uniref:uncharacterized protein n=1 Tax=Hypoxylon trugodes TaxID=326681 RepID=UPI00219D1127|nr:uncharacterized protein F4822DRAFT_314431 [Hypoxylon trugodes]KAI1386375.1 hypothetical protein F4822DRAFT_314431 [Hypoxylon trugodes]